MKFPRNPKKAIQMITDALDFTTFGTYKIQVNLSESYLELLRKHFNVKDVSSDYDNGYKSYEFSFKKGRKSKELSKGMKIKMTDLSTGEVKTITL